MPRSRSVTRSRSGSPVQRSPSRSPSRSRSRSPSFVAERRRSRSASRSPPPRRERRRTRSRSRTPDYRRERRGGGGGGGRRGGAWAQNRSRDNPDPSRCVGVFNLSLYTTEKDLRDVFGKYGDIEKVDLVYDHPTGRSRGFGFVYFESVDSSTAARDELNGSELDGHKIRVDYSITKRAHTPTPGQYMGGPGGRGGGGGGGGRGGRFGGGGGGDFRRRDSYRDGYGRGDRDNYRRRSPSPRRRRSPSPRRYRSRSRSY